jgi:hypothetical protein
MNERISPLRLVSTLVLAVALMMGLSGCELLPTEAEHQLSFQPGDQPLSTDEEKVIHISELHLHFTRAEVEERLVALALEGIVLPFVFDEEEGVWTYDVSILAHEDEPGLMSGTGLDVIVLKPPNGKVSRGNSQMPYSLDIEVQFDAAWSDPEDWLWIRQVEHASVWEDCAITPSSWSTHSSNHIAVPSGLYNNSIIENTTKYVAYAAHSIRGRVSRAYDIGDEVWVEAVVVFSPRKCFEVNPYIYYPPYVDASVSGNHPFLEWSGGGHGVGGYEVWRADYSQYWANDWDRVAVVQASDPLEILDTHITVDSYEGTTQPSFTDDWVVYYVIAKDSEGQSDPKALYTWHYFVLSD